MAKFKQSNGGQMTTILLALLSVFGLAIGDPTGVYAVDLLQDWQQKSIMRLSYQFPKGSRFGNSSFRVAPLTVASGANQSSTARAAINIEGDMVSVDTESNVFVGSDAIGYISCDSANSSQTNINPDTVVGSLLKSAPRAIVLYSTMGESCGLKISDSTYQTFYTMVTNVDARRTLDSLRRASYEASTDKIVHATISGISTSRPHDGQDGSNGNHSAVAMSILYSITGLITLLFLAIIATGAVRAHRYPERYGPRSALGGRPRQSRARGLARAVLETLPIVKFGEPTSWKAHPALELEKQSVRETPDVDDRTRHSVAQQDAKVPGEEREGRALAATTVDGGADTKNKRSTTASGAEAIANANASGENHGGSSHAENSAEGDNSGCPICTDDFAVGEDVRVLPCNHKFHPACIDPWLVNVSGTCPLCRLDLQPENPPEENSPSRGAAESVVDSNDALNPPRSRRTSRLLDLHRLRHATVEERIEILRRHRSQQQDRIAAPVDGQSSHDHSQASGRIRDRFRLRSRSSTPRPQAGS